MFTGFCCTRGGNRTRTPEELDFESSASTNSATRALKERKTIKIISLLEKKLKIYPLSRQINF